MKDSKIFPFPPESKSKKWLTAFSKYLSGPHTSITSQLPFLYWNMKEKTDSSPTGFDTLCLLFKKKGKFRKDAKQTRKITRTGRYKVLFICSQKTSMVGRGTAASPWSLPQAARKSAPAPEAPYPLPSLTLVSAELILSHILTPLWLQLLSWSFLPRS